VDIWSIKQLVTSIGINAIMFLAFYFYIKLNDSRLRKEQEIREKNQDNNYKLLEKMLVQTDKIFLDVTTRLTRIEVKIDQQDYCPVMKEKFEKLKKKTWVVNE